MRPRIVLLGMLTKIPVAGVAWLIGQYAAGFDRLGFETYYVEAHARTPSMFMEHEEDDGTQKAARFIASTLEHFGLAGRWALHALHDDGQCYGLSREQLERLYRGAALIVNMHGGTVPLPEHAATGRLIYLGTDPVELELELQRKEPRTIDFMAAHVAHFTWGLNYGNPDCSLPWSTEFPMAPSPPPVMIDQWQSDSVPKRAVFTTIGNWRQTYRDVTFDGEVYRWSKHHEFLKVLDLPRRASVGVELALSSYEEEDRSLLLSHGWGVRDGMEVSRDLDSYRDYIIASRGEFTVAKEQNIRFRSGWFSERSAAYLAAGRPVVMQDTGFGNYLPTGDGLVSFRDLDGAVDALARLDGDYDRHGRAATEVAREYFNYDVVLGRLADRVGLEIPNRPGKHRARTATPPADLPAPLRLTPRSRRPLSLAPETIQAVLDRPLPSVPPTAGNPRASVVVVAHQNLALTRMAVESVLANTEDIPYELIGVDNGSGDGTDRYFSVIAARNSHVRVILNESNRGFAAANNQALMVARGDAVVLLNNDTIVPKGWLPGLLTHLADPTIGLVGPTTNRCGNEAEVPASYTTYGELADFVAHRRRVAPKRVADIPVAIMFCVAFRRDTLAAVGLLDERYELGMFEDDDYALRVRNAGLRVVCAEDVFVHHFGEGVLGWLFAAGRYGEIFEANRQRFEAKWGLRWQTHRRRENPDYTGVRRRLKETITTLVPQGSVVLVISRGDDQLVEFPQRAGWHFPRSVDGTYPGHYPADDAAAIDLLEALRRRGAAYLAVPLSSLWWLDRYPGFKDHLQLRYERIATVPDTAVIFALREPVARQLVSQSREGSP